MVKTKDRPKYLGPMIGYNYLEFDDFSDSDDTKKAMRILGDYLEFSEDKIKEKIIFLPGTGLKLARKKLPVEAKVFKVDMGYSEHTYLVIKEDEVDSQKYTGLKAREQVYSKDGWVIFPS